MINSIKRTLSFINQHSLAKEHLLSAYLRLFNWQIKSMLNPNLQPVKYLQDTYFLAQKGLTGITGNIYCGLHEFEEMAFLLHFLKEEDLFFDVGANVGSYTLLASGVKKARTIAFEPILKTYNILEKNIKLNRLEHLVVCENKGVGKELGTLNFTDVEDTTNHVINEKTKNSISVDVVSLDCFHPKLKPALIKIDVEGFETEILNGAKNILSEPLLKAIVIELNGSGERYGFNEGNIHQKLLNAAFEPYSYDPFKRKLTKLNTYGNFNTIYIRDINFVKDRLCSSPKFTIFNQAF